MKKADIVFLTLTIALFSLIAMPLFYGVVYAKSSKGDNNSTSNGGDGSNSSPSSTSYTKKSDTKSDDNSNTKTNTNANGLLISGKTDDGKEVINGGSTNPDNNPPITSASNPGSHQSKTGDDNHNILPITTPTPPGKNDGNPNKDNKRLPFNNDGRRDGDGQCILIGGCGDDKDPFLGSPSPSPDQDCKFNPSLSKCKRVGENCPSGFFNNEDDNCVPQGDCPKGFKVLDDDETGKCTRVGVGGDNNNHDNQHDTTRTVVHTKVVVETKVKTVIINQFPQVFNAPLMTTQSNVLLLLDTGQVCAAAGDVQCVTTQNLFKIFNVITKFDGTAWHVSGQVKNVGKQTENNVQIIAHFYNSKGGNVNGLQQVFLNPMNLKSQQQGTFNIKAPTSQMSGIPTFVRLELVLSS
jgi:hypothetical protein